jgi:hypothetical protein
VTGYLWEVLQMFSKVQMGSYDCQDGQMGEYPQYYATGQMGGYNPIDMVYGIVPASIAAKASPDLIKTGIFCLFMAGAFWAGMKKGQSGSGSSSLDAAARRAGRV